MQILVACFGNVLRGDDGFGIVVAQRLVESGVPSSVRVLEIGIGGIHLVQELLDPVDALVVVDAVDVGRPPGTVVVIDPEVADVAALPIDQRRDALADMHYATPDRAFTLARGLGVLPPVTVVVGCQPLDAQRYGEGLSEPAAAAVDAAIAEVHATVAALGVDWH
ncbi:MAG: hydrogenase maturation protease [Gemmatimonadaceae bacterium]|nr:hydrogenase maturation protease [Gemmatimonadaceae bacterium]